MADDAISPARTRGRAKAEQTLDALLEEREALRARQESEKQRYQEIVALAKEQSEVALEGVAERIEAIDGELATYVKGHLRWLLLWFSKTMRRPSGEITIVNRAAELEMPKDEGLVTDQLELIPDGELYIQTIKQPARKALLQAPESVFAALRHLGVRRVPHDTISVKSLSDTRSKQIASWAVAERTRRSTPRRK